MTSAQYRNRGRARQAGSTGRPAAMPVRADAPGWPRLPAFLVAEHIRPGPMPVAKMVRASAERARRIGPLRRGTANAGCRGPILRARFWPGIRIKQAIAIIAGHTRRSAELRDRHHGRERPAIASISRPPGVCKVRPAMATLWPQAPRRGEAASAPPLPSAAGCAGDYAAFTAETSCVSDSLASPNIMLVLSLWNSSFSMPAKPDFMLRFSTITCCAWSTFRIGIP